MKSAKQIFSTLLILSSVALLTACNASNVQGSLDSSSVDLTSDKPISYCNSVTTTDVSAKLKVYVDASNTVQSKYMWVRLTSLPANFESGGSYISMWRWLAAPSGQTYLDNTALNAAIVNSSGQVLTEFKSTLRWSDLKALAASLGHTTAASFFSNLNILVDLRDAEGQYDVLKISVYDSTTNKATSQADALLPMFYANPAHYAYESDGQSRASVLQGLHPLKGSIGSSTSNDAYKLMANNLCFQ